MNTFSNFSCTRRDDSEVKEAPKPFLIAIAGGSASGKTSLCEKLISMLPDKRVALISQDSFYKPLSQEEKIHIADKNFDAPDALDFELMQDVLIKLQMGKRADIPIYDYSVHARKSEQIMVFSPDGILAFHNTPTVNMMNLFDLKIFVETDADVRLGRRVIRDVAERGRTVDSVLEQYEKFVKPAYNEFILPQKKCADLIIPWGDYSGGLITPHGDWSRRRYPALDMMVMHITKKLEEFDTYNALVGRTKSPAGALNEI